jgi:anion-transporting  ArsA/GET3 family ATPase
LDVLEKRLILVVGKGGVGRSTVAASLAAAAARRGKRTLLYQYNANDRYGGFFGTQPVGEEIARLRENLYAVNTNPSAALREYGLMVLRFKRVYNIVFENRITRYFLRAIPGLDDYSILGKCWYHTTETDRGGAPVWDTIVFDMAASGHSLSMLKIPWVILQTVPEGPLTRDAHSVQDLLLDRSRTSLVLVTLAEEMPSNEAHELSESLRSELGLEIDRLVVNQVYPDRFRDGSPERAVLEKLATAQAPPADLTAVARHAEVARDRRDLNGRYLEQLRSAIPAPQSELPLLFVPSLGPPEIEELSRRIESDLVAR